jgi:hypothetical protein
MSHKNRIAITLVILLGLLCVMYLCMRKLSTRSQQAFRGQKNASLTFYGKIVDEEGRPLSNVPIDLLIQAYPQNWSYGSYGRDLDATTANLITDKDGSFKIDVVGCKITALPIHWPNYRLLEETDVSDATTYKMTRVIDLIEWGVLWYKSSSINPTTYLLVKNGVHEVSALPCRGGYRPGSGTGWIANAPAWPNRPSLPDVVYKPAATQPSTRSDSSSRP